MGERDTYEWWNVEPPDYDLEPSQLSDEEVKEHAAFRLESLAFEDDNHLSDDYGWISKSEAHFIDLSLDEADILDASKQHDMFEGVVVKDDGSFVVPERYLRTADGSMWKFTITGRRMFFKERDDYGSKRFLVSGGGIWVPHLYPFEETDSNGLPLILDRERCEIEIVLEQVKGSEVYPIYAEINVGEQLYGAEQDPQSLMSDTVRYHEFTAVGRVLVSESLTYPEKKWRSLEEYCLSKYMDDASDRYLAMMLGNEEIPSEYRDQHKPHPWHTRQSSDLTGNAFGSIRVATDDIRLAQDATIFFPGLNDKKFA